MGDETAQEIIERIEGDLNTLKGLVGPPPADTSGEEGEGEGKVDPDDQDGEEATE